MIYMTSDCFGCDLNDVKDLLKKAAFRENDFCFVLGNVVDRGENGVKLLEWLMEQYNVELLRGCHEQLLLAHAYLFGPDAVPALTATQTALLQKWNELGAMPTVTALKAKKAEAREYIFEFLEDTPLFETVNAGGRDFILTHSGLGSFAPDKKLSAYSETELLWHDADTTDRYFDHATVVHGHTPTGDLAGGDEGKIYFGETFIDVNAGTPALLRLDDLKAFYLD